MLKKDVGLYGKLPAFTSWIQTAGILLFIFSRLVFRQIDWLLYLGSSLLLGATICRLYLTWKAGRKQAFRTRMLTLIGIVVVCLLLVLIVGNQQGN